MIRLNNILNHNNIYNNFISSYLKWYDIMPLMLVCHNTSTVVTHPYIRSVIKYYRVRDGIKMTNLEAGKLLTKTRGNLGSELVETAILENIDILNTLNDIPFDTINNVLNNKLFSSNEIYQADDEINQALIMSRTNLYQAKTNQLGIPNFKILSLEDSVVTYEQAYSTNILNGNILDKDTQIKLLVYRTNMPLSYSYIFMRRFLLQRTRTHFEIVSS